MSSGVITRLVRNWASTIMCRAALKSIVLISVFAGLINHEGL
jgi:hypothetical protein